MTDLHVVPPAQGVRSGRRIAERQHVRTQLHRDLRWLQVDFDHAQVNAYWACPIMPRRWLRFEVKRRSVVAGPLTLMVRVRKFPTPPGQRARLVAARDLEP